MKSSRGLEGFVFTCLLAPFLAWGAAAPRKPVIALLPATAADPDLAKLGLLMEARASELLEAAGKTRELHLRQVLAMARAEGLSSLSDPVIAEQARQALGADKAVTTTLRRTPAGLMLEGRVITVGKPVSFSQVLPEGWPAALVTGSEAIARALAGVPAAKGQVQPQSKSAPALRALADCWAVAIRQPLGVEEAVVVELPELEKAIASCQRAAELDPTLHFALATKALLQAIKGDDTGAVSSLLGLNDSDDMVEAFTLARFWLLTRYQSNEAGLVFLRESVKKHPGELILLSTLGEDYAAVHDDARALEAWSALLELAPDSPIALTHLSAITARAGRIEEGLVYAQRALALAPLSRAARAEVAARLLDLGRPERAAETIEPLANRADARAEHILELGRAYWLAGDAGKAAALFEVAAARAQPTVEWRTRGRAYYHLALAEIRRGNAETARSALRASLGSGLRMRQVDPALASLMRELSTEQVRGSAEHPPSLLPNESSLFSVDFFGDIEPSKEKPAPPEGLILFRF